MSKMNEISLDIQEFVNDNLEKKSGSNAKFTQDH